MTGISMNCWLNPITLTSSDPAILVRKVTSTDVAPLDGGVDLNWLQARSTYQQPANTKI